MPSKNPRRASDYDQSLGERVRAERLAATMSQEELAAKIGVTFQQLQKYEKGSNRISAAMLLQIAAALKIPAARLYEDAPVRKIKGDGGDVRGMIDNLRAIKLLKAFERLKGEKDRALVISLCEGLAE